MDPILLKALRELVEKQARLKAAGVAIEPAHVEEFLRVRTQQRYGLADAQRLLGSIDTSIGARNLGRSAAQGALMNWGDELLGVVGGEGAKEDMRLREALFRRDHPVADAVGGLAGGVGAAMLVPGAGAGATLGRAIAQGATVGAGAGLASGAGSGEGLRDRGRRAAIGAGVGLAGGVALPTIAAGAKQLVSPAARAGRKVADAVERSGGVGALRQSNQAFRDAGRGEEVMVGDLSDEMRGLTDFAANNSDAVYDALAPALAARQRDATGRVVADVTRAVGNPEATARQAELAASRSAWAAGPTGYEGLRQANPQLPADAIAARLETFLEQPHVASLWAEAQRIGLVGTRPNLRSQLSFQTLQNLKEALDNAVGRAFTSGAGDLGRRLGEVRDEVVSTMTDLVPGYAPVAAEYGRRRGLETAVEAGMTAWNAPDSRPLVAYVRQLSSTAGGQEALAEYRAALASQLISHLRSQGKNRRVATALTNMPDAMQDKLEIVFGDQATFRQFMTRVQREHELSRLASTVGNSATHRRGQAAQADPLEDVALTAGGQIVAGGPSGAALAVGGSLARRSRDVVARRAARRVGPTVMTRGSDAIDELLRTFTLRPPVVGRAFTNAAPAGLAGLLY